MSPIQAAGDAYAKVPQLRLRDLLCGGLTIGFNDQLEVSRDDWLLGHVHFVVHLLVVTRWVGGGETE